MFEYDYHCLIDNKRLRTHLLFHLALEYNIPFGNMLFGLLSCRQIIENETFSICRQKQNLERLVTKNFLPL